MKNYLGIALFMLAAALLPAAAKAAEPIEAAALTVGEATIVSDDPYVGRILLDVANHGEAWYVNPQSLQRVYLGRPDEALEKLKDRAIFVNFSHIARLAEVAGHPCDETYREQVAGYVLTPNDLIGASWYVDPASGLRRRLATPQDAWEIMRAGTPVSADVLKGIAIEGSAVAEEKMVSAAVKDVATATTLTLENGATVRILSVEVPSNPDLQDAAKAKLRELLKDRDVRLERDVDGSDGDGTLARHVRAGAALMSYELVRNGLAFHNIEEPNYKYAELLIVGGIDAARLKRGFWNR